MLWGFLRGENGLTAVERAFEMDVDHPIPLLRADLGKADEVADSSVVDQDVHATMLREEAAEGVLNLGRVSHVKSDGAGTATSSPNGFRCLGCWFEHAVIDDHMGATVGQNVGDGRTQPRPAPVTTAILPDRFC